MLEFPVCCDLTCSLLPVPDSTCQLEDRRYCGRKASVKELSQSVWRRIAVVLTHLFNMPEEAHIHTELWQHDSWYQLSVKHFNNFFKMFGKNGLSLLSKGGFFFITHANITLKFDPKCTLWRWIQKIRVPTFIYVSTSQILNVFPLDHGSMSDGIGAVSNRA